MTLDGRAFPAPILAAQAWARSHGYFRPLVLPRCRRGPVYSERGRYVCDDWDQFVERARFVSTWQTRDGTRVRARKIRQDGPWWIAHDTA